MTKEDILKMTKGKDIIHAMIKNPHLIDEEVAEHQKKVSQQEHIAEYGSLDVIFDPFKKK